MEFDRVRRRERAAVLRDPTQGSGTSQFAAIQAVAPSLRVEVNPANVLDPGEIGRALRRPAVRLIAGFNSPESNLPHPN